MCGESSVSDVANLLTTAICWYGIHGSWTD